MVHARDSGYSTLLTYGGAFSNHIFATAAAGREFGFDTIGIIRGEEHLPLNPTLEFASGQGMQLIYLSRTDYRKKHLPEFTEWIRNKFGNVHIIPEGGTNSLAVKGCGEILMPMKDDFDILCTSCGIAGTISGLIVRSNGEKKILGFSALRGGLFLVKNTEQLIADFTENNFYNWSINLDYHFGGYAKINRDLILFIKQFEEINGIPLDPIYTGKMMYGIYDLTKKGFFNEGKTIIALHTGGLQGVEGMREKMNAFLSNKVR